MHYMPTLLPVTFVLSELGEDPDLHAMARVSLSLASQVAISSRPQKVAVAHFLLLQVIMLPYVCRSVFEAVIGAASSASWHVRQRALNFIQVHSFLCPASSSFAPTNTLAHSLTSLT